MARIDNLGDKRGAGDFRSNPQNINKKGRPLSIKETYRRSLEENSGIIWQPIEWTGTEDEFDKFRLLSNIKMRRRKDKYAIGFQLRKKEELIVKIDKLIFNSKDTVEASMLKWIVEILEGKASQSIDVTSNGASISSYVIAPASVLKQMMKEDGEEEL